MNNNLAEHIFVGRKEEQAEIERILSPEYRSGGGMFIVGEGGSGKTLLLVRMLDIASKTQNVTVAKNIIDFRSTNNRHIEGIIESIIENLDFSGVNLAEYAAAENKLRDAKNESKNDPNYPAENLTEKRKAVIKNFDECLISITSSHKVVLAFDTFEDVQGPNEEIQNWLLGHSALRESKLIVLMASRNSLPIQFSKNIKEIKLGGLDALEEIMEVYEKYYYGDDPNRSPEEEARLKSLRADKDQKDLVQALHNKTHGNPLLLGLSVHWIKNYQGKEPITATTINNLTNEQFEEQLTRWFLPMSFAGPAGANDFEDVTRRVLIYMSYLNRRFNKNLLQMLFQKQLIVPVDLDSIWNSLIKQEPDFFYIKNRPDGEIQLHDKLADLLKRYCLINIFDEKDNEQVSILLNKLASATIEWYDQQIEISTNDKNVASEQINLLRAEKLGYALRKDILVDIYQSTEKGQPLGSLLEIKKALNINHEYIINLLRSYRTKANRSIILASLVFNEIQLDIIEQEFPNEYQYEIYNLLGKLSHQYNLHDVACKYFEQAYIVADKMHDSAKQVQAKIDRHNDTWQTNPKQSLEILNEAEIICKNDNEAEKLLPRVLYERGFTYRQMNDLTEAGIWYEKAEEQATRLKDNKIMPTILNDAGYRFLLMGDFNKGKTKIRTARDTRFINHKKLKQKLLDSKLSQSERENLEEELNEATKSLGLSYSTLGEFARYGSRLEEARDLYEEALSLFRIAASHEWETKTRIRLGEIYRRMAAVQYQDGHITKSMKFDKLAQNHIEQALVLAQQFGFRADNITATRRLGRLYHDRMFRTSSVNKKLALLAEAKKSFMESYSLASDEKRKDVTEIFENLTEIAFCADDSLEIAKTNRPDRFEKEKKEVFHEIEELRNQLEKYDRDTPTNKIYYFPVFQHLLEIEQAAYHFVLEEYDQALKLYIAGYIGMAQNPGYGVARYFQHRDHLVIQLRKLFKINKPLFESWCNSILNSWDDARLMEKRAELPHDVKNLMSTVFMYDDEM